MSLPATRRRPATRLLTVLAASAALVTAGCGAGADTPEAAGEAASEAKGFPLTVTNCGARVTLQKPPQRVVLLKSAAVPYLHGLSVLDRVVARAGLYPEDYYDAETMAELEKVPLLTDKTDTSGHLQISKEVVIAQKPDLVLGEVDNLNRDTLAAAGIPLLEEPAMCPEGVEKPGFGDLYSQMEHYGRVFDRSALAAERVTALRDRVDAVTARTGTGAKRTAAVLYPTVGGGTTYAYGRKSMADPQLAAAGLTNVFGSVGERVFEVGREELIGRNPDVLVLLHSGGDAAKVKAAVTSLAGADRITAVRNDDILVQLLNFTEPPTPLSLTGLERIVDRFGS